MFKHISPVVLFVFLLLAVPMFDAQPVQSAPGTTPSPLTRSQGQGATLVTTVQAATEATATATEAATPEATAPAVIIVAPAADVTPAPDTTPPREGYVSVLAAILIAVISAIAGGLAGGVGALRILVNFLDKVNRDTALLNAIEGLTQSVNADVLKALNLSGQIVTKVTDGKPELPNPADLGVLLKPDGSVAVVPKVEQPG